METVTLAIGGMTCGHCVRSVRGALTAIPGAEVQDVRIGSATLRLDGAQTEAALAAVRDAGYDAVVGPAAPPTLTPLTRAR